MLPAAISTQKLHEEDVKTEAVASDLSNNKRPSSAPGAKTTQTSVKWNIDASMLKVVLGFPGHHPAVLKLRFSMIAFASWSMWNNVNSMQNSLHFFFLPHLKNTALLIEYTVLHLPLPIQAFSLRYNEEET